MAEIKLKIASVVIGSGHGGGSGVAPYYADLPDKPRINGKTLSGNKTSKDLGLASEEQSVPSGGTTGQVLTKRSNLSNDVEWAPSSGIIGANANNLDAGSNATASIDENHILQLGIPVGRDAVNPFKGWFTTANIPTTGQEGDYCNVSDTSVTPHTVTIYRWSTAQNAFVDTGEVPDTATGETFASSETLQEVAIDDSNLVNPVNTADATQPVLAQAKDVMQLKNKLEGVTASEEKQNYTLEDGYVNYDGSIKTTSSNHVVIALGTAKKVRFLGQTIASVSSNNLSYAFWNSDTYVDSSTVVFSTYYDQRTGDTSLPKEYCVIVPSGATHVAISVGSLTIDDFYCYLQSGESVVDEIKKVDDKLYKVEEIDYESIEKYDYAIAVVNNTNYARWSGGSDYKHYLIPIQGGEVFEIENTLSSDTVRYAIMPIDTCESPSQSATIIVDGENIPVVVVTHKTKVTVVIPDDIPAEYCIGINTYGSKIYVRKTIYDKINEVYESIEDVDNKVDSVQSLLFESLKVEFDISDTNKHLYMNKNTKGKEAYWGNGSNNYYHFQIPLNDVLYVVINTLIDNSTTARYFFAKDVDNIGINNPIHYFNNKVNVYKMPEKGSYTVNIPEVEIDGEITRPAYLIVYAGTDITDNIESISIITTKSKGEDVIAGYQAESILNRVRSKNNALIIANPITEKHIENFQKKVRQLTEIEWTPKGNIPMAFSADDKTGNNFNYRNYTTGVPYTGIPYSGNLGRSVGFGVSLETFMTAVNNPYSLMYSEDLSNVKGSPWGEGVRYSRTNAHCRAWYGTYCNSFAQYVSGHSLPMGCSGLVQKYINTYGVKVPQLIKLPQDIRTETIDTLQPGDILSSSGQVHTRIVYDVERNENGHVSSISVAESTTHTKTTLNGHEYPIAPNRTCVINTYNKTADALAYYIVTLVNQGYTLYRNNMLFNEWHYEQSPFVTLEGETALPSYQYNDDICTFGGDKVAFLQGDLVVINFDLENEGNNWGYKNGYLHICKYTKHAIPGTDPVEYEWRYTELESEGSKVAITDIDYSSGYPNGQENHAYRIPSDVITNEGLYCAVIDNSNTKYDKLPSNMVNDKVTYFEIVSDDVQCKQIANNVFNISYGGSGKIVGCTLTYAAGKYAYIPLPSDIKNNSFDIDTSSVQKDLGLSYNPNNKISLKIVSEYGFTTTKSFLLKGEDSGDDGGDE